MTNVTSSAPVIVQRFRSLVIWLTAGLDNWVETHVRTSKRELAWQDYMRWFLEAQIARVFNWAYEGSDEEIEAVYDGVIPLDAMSKRQRALLVPPEDQYPADCHHCGWRGNLAKLLSCECPACGESAYVRIVGLFTRRKLTDLSLVVWTRFLWNQILGRRGAKRSWLYSSTNVNPKWEQGHVAGCALCAPESICICLEMGSQPPPDTRLSIREACRAKKAGNS